MMDTSNLQTSAGLRALADAIDAGALLVQSQTVSTSNQYKTCKVILYVKEIDDAYRKKLEAGSSAPEGHAVRTLSTAGASDREVETSVSGRVPRDPRAPWLVP